jgi:uncharacterized protein (TIGR02722 family)
MRLFRSLILAVLPLALLTGCATTKVERLDSDSVTDLSGNWNDTDSRLVAEEMITDALKRPWLTDFSAANKGAKPVVIVGAIGNRSDEHIDTTTFTKNLERELTNSGRVRFVASAAERNEVRGEREDQQANSSAASMKRMRNETGADYMLKGVITSILDQKGGEKVKYYQINLELIHMESNEKAWIGEKQIKKKVSRSRFGG